MKPRSSEKEEETMASTDRIRPLVAPILADLGLDLYDLEYAGGVVRVTIDKPGGVDMENIALATRLISREFDHSDPITGRYTLEVSSPGLERNLRTPDHFQRIVGWKVNVRTMPTVEGDRRVIGVLSEANAKTILITSAGDKSLDERRLGYHEIERAKTVFEWGGLDANAPSSKIEARKKPVTKKAAAPKAVAEKKTTARKSVVPKSASKKEASS
jgi:ribosome maturation factor RimP